MKLGYMEPVHPLDLPVAPYMYYSPNLVVPIHGEGRVRTGERPESRRRDPRAPVPGPAPRPRAGFRGRRRIRDPRWIRVRTGAGGRGTDDGGGKRKRGGGKRAGSSTGSGRGRRDTPGLCRDVRALCHFELSLSLDTRRTHIEGGQGRLEGSTLEYGRTRLWYTSGCTRGKKVVSAASRAAGVSDLSRSAPHSAQSVGTTVATSKRPSGSTLARLTTHQGCSSTTSLCPSMCTPCLWRWCAGSSLNGFCLVVTVASVMYVCSRSLSSKLLMHFRKLGSRR